MASELELNRRLAAAQAREDRDRDVSAELGAELSRREADMLSREKTVSSRRERLELREARLLRLEQEIVDRGEALDQLEDEVRVHEARREAELELREDRLEERLRELAEREARMEQREHDLAGYVATVQQRFSAA